MYKASAELETITDKARKEARLKAGVMPFDAMQAGARAAGAANFVSLRRNLRDAQAAWTAMGEILDRVAGRDSPPTRQISEMLDEVLLIINQYAPPEVADAPAGDAAAGEEAGGGDAETTQESDGQMVRKKKMVTREDALASLTEIAEFFRRTEPQSPLAYTIDEAIRRGRMAWPELLAELISDDNVRKTILNSLGIKPV
jgi:type VI secretion system protein ImpA